MTRLAFTAHTLVAPSATSANIASDHSFNEEPNDPFVSLVCILQYSPKIPSFKENHLLCNPVVSLSCRLGWLTLMMIRDWDPFPYVTGESKLPKLPYFIIYVLSKMRQDFQQRHSQATRQSSETLGGGTLKFQSLMSRYLYTLQRNYNYTNSVVNWRARPST